MHCVRVSTLFRIGSMRLICYEHLVGVLRGSHFSLVQGMVFIDHKRSVIELQTFIAVLVSRFHFKIAQGYSLRRDGCHITVVSDTF
jgi:hypothetical protein